ncbi:MAG TPA: hypothetical protein HA319_03790 [Nitrosopumilaceae archaeon]|jgi:hypothetical protein|nr:hypothetical protein [Nitrosopumilaceae archaeon]
MQWKLEREEGYFKIFDENKNIAGYFDPSYGDIFPEHKISEIIEEMHKKHEKILGGFLMVPMIKFEVFNDQEIGLDYLQRRIDDVKDRISKWKDFILNQKSSDHKIQVSHTDTDMLSITFPIHFNAPVSLEKKLLLAELEISLNSLHEKGLL